MGYIILIIGIMLLAIFTWILIRNSRRSGFIHTLFRIDTIAGMICGTLLDGNFSLIAFRSMIDPIRKLAEKLDRNI